MCACYELCCGLGPMLRARARSRPAVAEGGPFSGDRASYASRDATVRRVGALRIAPAGSCHRVSTRVRDMSEITTREYRNEFVFRAPRVARDPPARPRPRAHVVAYHLRDTSSKVSVYLSREFAEKKNIWRTRPRPTGGGTRVF